jgi:hypothetical protein
LGGGMNFFSFTRTLIKKKFSSLTVDILEDVRCFDHHTRQLFLEDQRSILFSLFLFVGKVSHGMKFKITGESKAQFTKEKYYLLSSTS